MSQNKKPLPKISEKLMNDPEWLNNSDLMHQSDK